MEKTLNILQPIYIVMNGCHILKILVRVVGIL